MKKVFLIAISIFLLGCNNNTFYLDEETGVLHPCGTSKIASVFITDQNRNYTSVIADWEDASNSLSLFDIPPEYNVKDELGNNKNFKIEANMTYSVLHSTQGDASSHTLTFSTDANRTIIRNSSSSCPK